MFFKIHGKIKDLLNLYSVLEKGEEIPKNWWWWDKKKEAILKLDEADKIFIEDLLDLYNNLNSLMQTPSIASFGKEKVKSLLGAIYRDASELKKHLEEVKDDIKKGKAPSGQVQYEQEEIIKDLIHKIGSFLSEFAPPARSTGERNATAIVNENTEHSAGKRYFTFYRAERKGVDHPALVEDPSGQFGTGVYFALTKDLVDEFASGGSVFKFFIDPTVFLKELNPILISKEQIIPFEDSSPDKFIEYLKDERGYGTSSFCVIGPMPDFNYMEQLVIEKDAVDRLIAEGLLLYQKLQ